MSKNEYFNIDTVAAAYKKLEGCPLDERILEIIRAVEPHINQAYSKGYQDDMEAVRKVEQE